MDRDFADANAELSHFFMSFSLAKRRSFRYNRQCQSRGDDGHHEKGYEE